MDYTKPALETERLILRRYRKDDLDDLFEYLSDPATVAFEPYGPMSREEAQKSLEWRISTGEMVAAELRSSGKLIGNIYLGQRDFQALELGFVFNRRFWGKGLAAEGCRALIQQAFAHGVHRIFAECDPNNENSWRLLEALDFRREAHLKQNVFFQTDGEGRPLWKDTYIYARLNDTL